MKTTSIFPVNGLASLILMSKHAQSRQFFEGVFRQYILQGWFKMKTTSIFPVHGLASLILTRLGQLGANISPDRSSLTPQVLIGNFLKHNYPLLYELQHINLLCLYLPKEDGVSPDAEYITQIIFSIFLQ